MNLKGTGAEYLVEKSDLARLGKEMPKFRDIVVFEDERLDSDRLLATLRTIYGYEIEVRRARTLTSGIDLLLAKLPDLVMLDDYMGPTDRADDALPLIRRAGFTGPIVVVSGELNRNRRTALLRLGVADAINKDDLDSGSIGKVLLQLAERLQQQLAEKKA
jgi:DNA-binding NarL/FixJ family response regulator